MRVAGLAMRSSTALGDSGATSTSFTEPTTRNDDCSSRIAIVYRPSCGCERVAHAGAVQGHFANSPARIAAQNIVDVTSLVYAMERAGPEVDDADA